MEHFNHVAISYANLLEQKKVLNGKNVHLPQEWFGTPKWPSFLGHRGYVRSGNLDLDFEIRISDLKSNAKSENGFKR